ncbi:hypothetical protein BD626DRAFT_456172 [Schizophyllum amplum]|uniref:NAD(P)-binding protein n=1 Tax=Schizophyllum amplum TaxID=97359 RepID=A0A550CG64_9AGAR|nr:hypothetical protein BD626DRAFT_456172 [Auriculariopsis ampla]
MGQAFSEAYPPKPTFNVADVPDLSGKVIIVTGGNSGIGKETVKALLQQNARVYIGARSAERASKAIKELKDMTGKEASFLDIDLEDLKSVKAAAAEFQSQETQLHVLFNNAGVMMCPTSMVTVGGYDFHFGTNVLGHFYLTKLLLPTLLSTAEISGENVRIVNTSSSGHTFVKTIDFNTLKDGPARRKLSPRVLYSQSKFGNVVLANELAHRYGDQGITSTALNPGNLQSNLQRYLNPVLNKLFQWFILYPTPFGALTLLYAGTMGGKELNGKYLIPWARVGNPGEGVDDRELGKAFWNWCEEQVIDI